jgi:hypothetical protein
MADPQKPKPNESKPAGKEHPVHTPGKEAVTKPNPSRKKK